MAKARKKVGLALGAGSARGLAHMGLLCALDEYEIPVDMICGSSMGSIVGAMYACNTDLEKWAQALPHMEKGLMDLVMPRRGFIRGNKVMELLRLVTKNMDFEQTRIPYTCVAVDVHRGTLKVFDSGKISDAVRASIAIPGVFEPYEIDGATYVDGGVLVRVPTKQVRDMGADVVIGVDVGYRGETGLIEDDTNLLQILLNSFDILQWEVTKKAAKYADMMLVPPVQHIMPQMLSASQECYRIGYETAVEAMPAIKALLES